MILLIDEVYVKPSLLYHGGTVSGKAVNKPSALANTVLGFFLVGLFGGPKFLLRMIPVTELDSIFLFDECQKVINSINEAGGNVISIISDDNRVNQNIFKTFDCVLNKPWLTKNGIYLLFDFVHLLKSIRNNWITEKTKELVFPDNGEMKAAKWEGIVTLYKAEESNIVKMAKLTEVSVFSKPIERQKVSICLKVFSENTIAALKTSSFKEQSAGTVSFLELIVKFWKIVNVKGVYAGSRFNDTDRAPIRYIDDPRLTFLLNLADVADSMKGTAKSRVKQLTRDTSLALAHTCRAFVDLTIHLLSTT